MLVLLALRCLYEQTKLARLTVLELLVEVFRVLVKVDLHSSLALVLTFIRSLNKVQAGIASCRSVDSFLKESRQTKFAFSIDVGVVHDVHDDGLREFEKKSI